MCAEQIEADNVLSLTGLGRQLVPWYVSRTLPLYFLLLAVTWPWLTTREAATALTFTQNFVWAGNAPLWGYWIGPTWSLAIEEQFYLFLPLVVFLIPRGRLPYCLIAIVVAAEVFRFFTTRNQGFFLLPGRMDSLALGVLFAWRVKFDGLRLRTLFRSRPIEWLGRLSYPAYLFHLPCSGVAIWLCGSGLIALAVSVPLLIAVSWGLNLAIESPLHGFGIALSKQRFFGPSALMAPSTTRAITPDP